MYINLTCSVINFVYTVFDFVCHGLCDRGESFRGVVEGHCNTSSSGIDIMGATAG